MRFAKVVFYVAAGWGIIVLSPLYFMFDVIGRQNPPPITHPGFYYAFIGSGLAWQAAFYVIATNPPRYRPLMIPAVLEKITYSVGIIVLFMQRRINAGDLVFGGVDMLFAVLFFVSFLRTPSTM